MLVAMSRTGIAACMRMIGGKKSPPVPSPARNVKMTCFALRHGQHWVGAERKGLQRGGLVKHDHEAEAEGHDGLPSAVSKRLRGVVRRTHE